MQQAVELLEVIEASQLPFTDALEAHRRALVGRVEERLKKLPEKGALTMAEELAGLLVGEGLVMAEQDSVRDVIAEYLALLSSEQAALGDEEKDFLANFLG